MLNKIWIIVKHNQTFFIALGVCVAMLIWGFGCEPSVKSPFDPNKKVTRLELDVEVEAIAKRISLAYAEIKRQEQIRDAILNAGLAYAQGSGINPVGLALTLAGILGVGVVVDNRKKDAVINAKDKTLCEITKTIKGVT